jgi:catechol 2,3-dioxygenase-like lactoylglutathione lyase family enzyme
MKDRIAKATRTFLALTSALALGAPVAAQGPEVASALEFTPFMVAISVQDIEKETAWFVDNLGFMVEKDASVRDGAVKFRWLINGTQRIELLSIAGSQPGPTRATPPGHAAIRGITQVTLETRDIVATRAALAAKGITPALDITDVAVLGIKAMYLLDPEGNAIEIAQTVGG